VLGVRFGDPIGPIAFHGQETDCDPTVVVDRGCGQSSFGDEMVNERVHELLLHGQRCGYRLRHDSQRPQMLQQRGHCPRRQLTIVPAD
jgi:hypothetical protein